MKGKKEYDDYLNLPGSDVPREIDRQLGTSASTFEFTSYCELKQHVRAREMTVAQFIKTANGRLFGEGPSPKTFFNAKSPAELLDRLNGFYLGTGPCMCNFAAISAMDYGMLSSAKESKKNMKMNLLNIIHLNMRNVGMEGPEGDQTIVKPEWIPGDWGYVYKQSKDYSEALDKRLEKMGKEGRDLFGSEGENIIYLGNQLWGGWNRNGIGKMGMKEWQDNVRKFRVPNGENDNHKAPVRPSVRFPMTGIRHFQQG